MLIFDAHLDLAWNAIDWNRDLRLTVRRDPPGENDAGMTDKGRGVQHRRLPRPAPRQGRHVHRHAACRGCYRIGAMPAIQRYDITWRPPTRAALRPDRTTTEALEQQGVLRWIKDWPALDSARRRMEGRRELDDEPLGFILSMEGADPVLRPDQVQEWYDAGLRIIGPAHYGVSPYAHGTGTEGGLFPQGRPLLKEMERVGMILDVTHLSDQCFDEAMDIYGGPVLASHHNYRALVPDQRQLTDEQIKRLIGRGAVIGPALDTWMLDARLGARRDARRRSRRQAGSHRRSHRPRLPARRQRPPRRHRHRPRRRLRHGAVAAATWTPSPTCRTLPRLLRKRGYKEADIEGHHARQLGAVLPDRLEEITFAIRETVLSAFHFGKAAT